MSQFNFAGGSTAVNMLAAVSAANTAAATSTGVDLLDYEGPVLVVQNHGTGTGTLDGKIQDSADNASFADVSPAISFTQVTTTADTQKVAFNAKSVRRYVRYVGTIVTGPHLVGVTLVGFKKTV